MKWTTKKPTKDGWYWAMFNKNCRIFRAVVEVKLYSERRGAHLYALVGGKVCGLWEFAAFAGPIPEPEGDEIEVGR